jgi:hypothetical protein
MSRSGEGGVTPEQPAWGTETAAAYLARLSGLPEDCFSGAGRKGGDLRRGADAIARACEVRVLLNGTPAAEEDRALRKQILSRYREAVWVPHFEQMNRAFFEFREGWFYSPLHDRDARRLGSILLGPFQVNVCLDGERLVFLFGVGKEPFGMYYAAENLLLWLHGWRSVDPNMLRRLLHLVLPHAERFAGWVHRAMEGGLGRVFVVGDNRPGHFIKQSLAYLDRHEDELILPFLGRGGRLVLIPDWCAMDPLPLFPSLAGMDHLVLGSEGASEKLLDLGLDAHRVYRFTTHKEPSWLRRRFAALARGETDARLCVPPGRRFKVLISLDAERQRIVNQVEAFRFVLRKLGAACVADGSALDVVWDGWTMPGVPNERDRTVLARIEALIGQITEDLGVSLRRQVRVFDRSAAEKIPETGDCDLVLVTQGTGAVVPCWLLQRPTITYHVADMVGDRSCLDESVAYNVDQRAIEPPPPDVPLADQHRRFSIALWGLEEALMRAVGSRLTITRELPGPD